MSIFNNFALMIAFLWVAFTVGMWWIAKPKDSIEEFADWQQALRPWDWEQDGEA